MTYIEALEEAGKVCSKFTGFCTFSGMKMSVLFLFLSLWGLQAQSGFEILGTLPQQLNESSGLLVSEGRLISHNDSGNEALLYELDSVSLEIMREVRVTNATNSDWEDLAQDDAFLYIADIGNNTGTRRDLRILKISKADFRSNNAVSADIISFSYEDQTDFSGGSNSDWDAEALIAEGDSLYIFTKQWQSLGTAIYSLPKESGSHVAKNIAEFPLNGLVTGADLISAENKIIILGYSTQLQPFIFSISSVTSTNFPGPVDKYTLPIGFAQAEGVAVGNNNMLYVSSERFSNSLLTLPASVFKLKWGEAEAGNPNGGEPEPDPEPEDGTRQDDNSLLLVSSPDSDVLQYRLPSEDTVLAQAVFDSSGRQLILQKGPEIQEGQVDISGLGPAVYYLTLFLGSKARSKAFLRY